MKSIVGVPLILFNLLQAIWIPVGPGGGPIYSGNISETNPAVIYIAPYSSTTRLLRSTDSGENWVQTSGALSGTVTDILVHPVDPEVVYGLIGTSIYKSTDGGSSWVRLNTPSYNYLRNLVFNPQNPEVIYATGYNYSSSPYEAVLLRSDDGGETWNTFYCDTSPEPSYGYSVAVDPEDTSRIYVGGYRGSGTTVIYRSTDRGETWDELPFSVAGYYPYGLYISPEDPNLIFVAPYTSGIYRSTDRGENWSKSANLSGVYRLKSAQGNPAVYYATTTSSVYRSQDTGKTWSLINRGLNGTPYFCLITDPNIPSKVYVGTKTGLFGSSDYGDTWENLTADVYLGKIKVIALGKDGGTVYVECQDDAIYKSTDNGETWSRCPEFLSCGNICGIVVNPLDPQEVWALEGSG